MWNLLSAIFFKAFLGFLSLFLISNTLEGLHQGRKSNDDTQQTWWRRLEDVLKTFFVFRRRLDQDEYIPLTHTSPEDVFRRRLQNTLIKTNIIVLVIRLQDVFKTFSRRLQDVFKTSCKNVFKTSSRRFQDVFKTSCQDVFKTSSRLIQDILKTSSRRLAKISSRHFQDLSSS